MKTKLLRNPWFLSSLTLLIFFGLLGGAFAYRYNTDNNKSKSTTDTVQNDTSIVENQVHSTPNQNTKPKNENTQIQNTSPTNTNPSYQYQPKETCDLQIIKYKITFEHGNYPIVNGATGRKEICKNSEGRVSSTTVTREPKNEIIYISSASHDYNTAKGICDAYINAYVTPYISWGVSYYSFEECMAIANDPDW